MSDEIKEILDKLKDSVDNSIDTEVDQFTQEAYDVPNYFCLDPITNDCKLLLDYITNLQQEKDYLDDYNRHLHNENERLNSIINELENKLKNVCINCYEDKEVARIEKWIKELKKEY